MRYMTAWKNMELNPKNTEKKLCFVKKEDLPPPGRKLAEQTKMRQQEGIIVYGKADTE